MFGFPAFYKYLLRWLVRGWPLMTVVLALGSLWLFVRYLRNRRDRKSLFLLGALYIPALSSSFFESSYDVEYTLHLYPLVALIVAAVIWKTSALAWTYLNLQRAVSRRTLFLLVITGFLLISQDTNPAFAWKIGERTYQSEKPPFRNVMAFPFYSDYHSDIKGVSNYVREKKSDGDKILVFAPNHVVQIVDFYVGEVDFWVTIEEKKERRGVVRNGGIFHYTSDCKSITHSSRVEEMVEKESGALWLIGDYRTLEESNPWFSSSKIKEKMRSLAENPDYVARDGITFVKKIP
jgi:hypothetical protein